MPEYGSAAHRQLIPILRWLFSAEALAPEQVEFRARTLVADMIGCILAGFTAAPVAQYARDLAELSAGEFPLGVARLTPLAAAQPMAIAATWDEACEGLPRAHGRPGVPVVPTALAMGFARDATLGEVLKSVVTGYEVGARMGEWLRNKPGMHVDGGWPALGVAAAATRMLGRSADDALAAIETVACQLPVGLYAPVRAGATARNSYPAHTTALGMIGATSVSAGMDAPDDGLSGHAAIALGYDPDLVSFAPAGEYLLLQGYLKSFAGAKHIAYAAMGALQIRNRFYTRLADITRIQVLTYPEAATYAANRAPRTPIAAQFSVSFGAAAALRFGDLSPQVYREPRFSEPGLRKLEGLVEVGVDETVATDVHRGAKLIIHLGDERHEATVHRMKGDWDDPFTGAECRDKLVRLAGPNVGTDRARSVADAILEGTLDQPIRAIWQRLWS